jgi:hypothetical protein
MSRSQWTGQPQSANSADSLMQVRILKGRRRRLYRKARNAWDVKSDILTTKALRASTSL